MGRLTKVKHCRVTREQPLHNFCAHLMPAPHFSTSSHLSPGPLAQTLRPKKSVTSPYSQRVRSTTQFAPSQDRDIGFASALWNRVTARRRVAATRAAVAFMAAASAGVGCGVDGWRRSSAAVRGVALPIYTRSAAAAALRHGCCPLSTPGAEPVRRGTRARP